MNAKTLSTISLIPDAVRRVAALILLPDAVRRVAALLLLALPGALRGPGSEGCLYAADTGGSAGSASGGGAVVGTLTFFGRASVKIVTSEGIVIYIDPFAPGDYSQPADILLVTHGHSDHNKVKLVTLKPGARVIGAAGSIDRIPYETAGEDFSATIGALTIRAVPAYNKNHDRASSVGYLLSWNGITVYHAGDTSTIPEMRDFPKYRITYALLNCDAVFNMTPEEASEVGRLIEARHIIPIHSSGSGLFDRGNSEAVTCKSVIVMERQQTIDLTSP